jgi:hypothetical protein
MSQRLFDAMESMEGIVPEYGYSGMEKMMETDRRIKEFLVQEMKEAKERMFHVVQVSYELQKDRLSEAAEGTWDGITALMSKVQAARLSEAGDEKGCERCMKAVEKNMRELIMKDRELVTAVREMKAVTRMLHRELFDKGKERYFIKNLKRINNYVDEVSTLLDQRSGFMKVSG